MPFNKQNLNTAPHPENLNLKIKLEINRHVLNIQFLSSKSRSLSGKT